MRKLFLFIIFFYVYSYSQETNSILDNLKNLNINFFIDTYFSYDFGTENAPPVTNDRVLSATAPFNHEFRLNEVYLKLNLKSENQDFKLKLQYGDIPFIHAPVEKQFIKYLGEAAYGISLGKDTWIHAGLMNNPIGFEDEDPYLNILSTISIGGYCQPGGLIGIKILHNFSESFSISAIYGNCYSILSSNNTNESLVLSFGYNPSDQLSLFNNIETGNEAIDGGRDKWLIYNNFIISFELFKNLSLVGQIDFASQQNSRLSDSTAWASMISSELFLRYKLSEVFSVSARYEYYYDPDGFISDNPLKTNGFAAGFLFLPTKNTFIRAEYNYLYSDKGIFYKNKDYRANFTVTSGIKF